MRLFIKKIDGIVCIAHALFCFQCALTTKPITESIELNAIYSGYAL